MTDKDCRVIELFERSKLAALCEDYSLFKNNWYGQLMTAPQVFAYILQTEYWLRRYDVRVEK